MLTEAERVRIRHHLGYIGVADAFTFVLGSPAAVETQFLIEGAMDRVLAASIPEVRRLVAVLDGIEAQMIGDHELAAVNKLGEIEINQQEQAQLTRRYDYWAAALANILGTYRNPFDRRLAVGGINVRVQ